jgi:hypothetical protein
MEIHPPLGQQQLDIVRANLISLYLVVIKNLPAADFGQHSWLFSASRLRIRLAYHESRPH